jgi:hypothetical protein
MRRPARGVKRDGGNVWAWVCRPFLAKVFSAVILSAAKDIAFWPDYGEILRFAQNDNTSSRGKWE